MGSIFDLFFVEIGLDARINDDFFLRDENGFFVTSVPPRIPRRNSVITATRKIVIMYVCACCVLAFCVARP
jgi:hypothetical protein